MTNTESVLRLNVFDCQISRMNSSDAFVRHIVTATE